MRSYKTISPSEAAKRLGYIDSRWVQRQAKAGKIPGAYYTETGRVRIPVAWVTWRKFLDTIGYGREKGGRKRGYSPKNNCVEE